MEKNYPFCKHIYVDCMFLSCHVHVLEWILCSHSYLKSIFVSSNYYPNVMQIVKAKKMYSVMIYFSCYNLLLWFLFDSHFWWIYSFMEIITYLIVASILNWIIIFYRKWYINETTDYWAFLCMKTIYSVFYYQKHLFFLSLSLGHIGMEINEPWKSNIT